jgi:hypothetical protein
MKSLRMIVRHFLQYHYARILGRPLPLRFAINLSLEEVPEGNRITIPEGATIDYSNDDWEYLKTFSDEVFEFLHENLDGWVTIAPNENWGDSFSLYVPDTSSAVLVKLFFSGLSSDTLRVPGYWSEPYFFAIPVDKLG